MKKDIVKIVKEDKYEKVDDDFIPEPVCRKCRDWPYLAEEQNFAGPSEYLSDGLIRNILNTKVDGINIYIEEAHKSVDFIENIKIPDKYQIKLTKTPGCRLCHNELIIDKIHYALLSGICDIKTVQYWLFKQGIFYKEWYIRTHLSHINFYEKINPKVFTDKKILDDQIQSTHLEIMQLTELGNKGNSSKLMELRKLLINLIDFKTKNYIEVDNYTGKQVTSLGDLKKQILDFDKNQLKNPKKEESKDIKLQ